MKATKKPIEIEYYPCEQKYKQKILAWATKERPIFYEGNYGDEFSLKISTLEGVVSATENDVIIKGVNGEVYPCKRDIFKKTYNF